MKSHLRGHKSLNIYLILILIVIIFYYASIQSGKEGYGLGEFINNFQYVSDLMQQYFGLMKEYT